MTDSGRAEDFAHQVRRPRKAPKSKYHQNMPEGEQGDNLWQYARMRRDHHTRGPFALSFNVPCYWDIARKAIESEFIIFYKSTQHRALWHAVFRRWATALLPQSFLVCTLLGLLRLGLLEGLSRISDVSRQQMRISLINGCVGVSHPSTSSAAGLPQDIMVAQLVWRIIRSIWRTYKDMKRGNWVPLKSIDSSVMTFVSSLWFLHLETAAWTVLLSWKSTGLLFHFREIILVMCGGAKCSKEGCHNIKA